ncbi:MAG: hypothetical protein VB055_03480 [Oscillospiraceae bacterium]|nr:hypothetical protein [Oscillospiraceae bacterium]
MTIHLPKERGGEDNFEIVSVGGQRYKIMRGVDVEVPEAVSEVLLHRDMARRQSERYLERVSAR